MKLVRQAKWKLLLVTAALATLPMQGAYGQQAPARDPMAPLPQGQTARPTAPPAATTPAPSAQPAPVAPVELPPLLWQVGDAQELLAAINSIGTEGLDPADYDPAGLALALRSGDPMAMSKAATDRFNKLSSDLALGHVRGKDRQGWFVVDKDIDAARQRALLEAALFNHSITASLQSLLPTHPQYASLRQALAMAAKTDRTSIDRIRLNMDRWRWLPKELGQKYIIVNVPAFHATLVENGATRWKHRAIAGATSTPTPQLSVLATGVMLNPWWEVPPSITREVAGKPGYVALKKDGKLLRWRQPPGPSNALGQLKFVMYNPQNIYLHDTNARSRFSGRMRALSHGCIRTENILDLATQLLGDDGGEWTPDKIQEVLASGKTKQVNFVKPVPVYIVYFSAAALNDGSIISYKDLYNRDGKVLAALNDRGTGGAKKATQTAAR